MRSPKNKIHYERGDAIIGRAVYCQYVREKAKQVIRGRGVRVRLTGTPARPVYAIIERPLKRAERKRSRTVLQSFSDLGK